MKWFFTVLKWAGIIEEKKPEPAPKKKAPRKKKVAVDLDAMTKRDLVDFASSKSIQLHMSQKKSDMIAIIKKQL